MNLLRSSIIPLLGNFFLFLTLIDLTLSVNTEKDANWIIVLNFAKNGSTNLHESGTFQLVKNASTWSPRENLVDPNNGSISISTLIPDSNVFTSDSNPKINYIPDQGPNGLQKAYEECMATNEDLHSEIRQLQKDHETIISGKDEKMGELQEKFKGLTRQMDILLRLSTKIMSTIEIEHKNNSLGEQASEIKGPLPQLPHLQRDNENFISAPPTLQIDTIKAVSSSEIFINWRINNGNSNVTSLELVFYDEEAKFIRELNPSSTSYLIDNLRPSTTYSPFALMARNQVGEAIDERRVEARTLDKNPLFIPKVAFTGSSRGTVTLGWSITPNLNDFYHYYNVSVLPRNGQIRYQISDDESETPEVIVTDLKSGMDYSLRVAACSKYTKRCDEFSAPVNGTTMDGKSSSPSDVVVTCQFDNQTNEATVHATWNEPDDPQGMIMEYSVTLYGNATYHNEEGQLTEVEVGPIKKTVWVTRPRKIDFPKLPPNTQFFFSVCARTRSRLCGQAAVASCSTPSTFPDTDALKTASTRAGQDKK